MPKPADMREQLPAGLLSTTMCIFPCAAGEQFSVRDATMASAAADDELQSCPCSLCRGKAIPARTRRLHLLQAERQEGRFARTILSGGELRLYTNQVRCWTSRLSPCAPAQSAKAVNPCT